MLQAKLAGELSQNRHASEKQEKGDKGKKDKGTGKDRKRLRDTPPEELERRDRDRDKVKTRDVGSVTASKHASSQQQANPVWLAKDQADDWGKDFIDVSARAK